MTALRPIPDNMLPWSGGSGPPADWDGGKVLCRNGDMMQPDKPQSWLWADDPRLDIDAFYLLDCVAYTPATA